METIRPCWQADLCSRQTTGMLSVDCWNTSRAQVFKLQNWAGQDHCHFVGDWWYFWHAWHNWWACSLYKCNSKVKLALQIVVCEELKLHILIGFNMLINAICRWDLEAMEGLPEYMRICYMALYNTTNEICYKILKENGWSVLPYLKATVIQSFSSFSFPSFIKVNYNWSQ